MISADSLFSQIQAAAIIIIFAGLFWFTLYNSIEHRYVIFEGTSMEPTIHAGDHGKEWLEPYAGTVQTGQIISIWWIEINHFVSHRIISENATHIQTKGDNNPVPDSWFLRTQVHGVIVEITRI